VDTEYQLGKEQFQEAFKYNPNKLNIQLEIAEIEYMMGNFEESESKAQKVLKSEP